MAVTAMRTNTHASAGPPRWNIRPECFHHARYFVPGNSWIEQWLAAARMLPMEQARVVIAKTAVSDTDAHLTRARSAHIMLANS
jgi:hypothetical protein